MGTCENFCRKQHQLKKLSSNELQEKGLNKIDQEIPELMVMNQTNDQSSIPPQNGQTHLSSSTSKQETHDENIAFDDRSSIGGHEIASIPLSNDRHNRFVECRIEEFDPARFVKKKKRKKHSKTKSQDRLVKKMKELVGQLNKNRLKKDNESSKGDNNPGETTAMDPGGHDEEDLQSNRLDFRIKTSSLVKGILKNHAQSADSAISMGSSSGKKSVAFSKGTIFTSQHRKGKHGRMISVSQQEFLKKLRVILERQEQ